MAYLLPYLEQGNLWRESQTAFGFHPGFYSVEHEPIRTTVLKGFICPSDGQTMAHPKDQNLSAAVTHYLGLSGSNLVNGVLFYGSSIRFSEITDGLSQTAIIGERPSRSLTSMFLQSKSWSFESM